MKSCPSFVVVVTFLTALKALDRIYNTTKQLAPVVRRVVNAIHWINHYPLENSIGFVSVIPSIVISLVG